MTNLDHDRFKTERTHLQSFGGYFLVKCPECDECARVKVDRETESFRVRFGCAHCGCLKSWIPKSRAVYHGRRVSSFGEGECWVGGPVDWYFHFPLWLQGNSCGELLWAYNGEHLAWLKGFVAAKHRERSRDEKWGWSNQEMASRLPLWIKSAHNREKVLSTIARLERMIRAIIVV